MTADVYIVVPKLFIQPNPVCHRQIMTPMPLHTTASCHLCIIFILHELLITLTYHIEEAIHFLAYNYKLQI
jgi:hypothetical protein